MSRDYAKKKRSTGAVRKPATGARKKQAPPQRSVTWFFSGVACGVFLSFLVWLAAQQPDPAAGRQEQKPAANESAEEFQKLDFTFHELLPEQDVTVEVDPADIARARKAKDMDRFLLQAGSFRQQDDAERRRAELLLLGLNPTVQETTGQNGRWYRVYIGPFESRSKFNKARSLTAQQGIETLPLKRPAG